MQPIKAFKEEHFHFARNIPLFYGLTEEEKDIIFKKGHFETFQAKSVIFNQGDPAGFFYVVCEGSVQLSHKMPNGYKITTYIVVPGNAMGGPEIFSPGNLGYHSCATAVDDVTAFVLPEDWLKAVALTYGIFSFNLLTAVSQYTLRLRIESAQQATMSASQLVGCFFQHLCSFCKLDPKGFDLPYSKALIASRLGMEQETLSRTLPKLKEVGISVEGRRVSIDDVKLLDRNVCEHCSAIKDCNSYKKLRGKG